MPLAHVCAQQNASEGRIPCPRPMLITASDRMCSMRFRTNTERSCCRKRICSTSACTVLTCCFTTNPFPIIRFTPKAAVCTGSPEGSISQKQERFFWRGDPAKRIMLISAASCAISHWTAPAMATSTHWLPVEKCPMKRSRANSTGSSSRKTA